MNAAPTIPVAFVQKSEPHPLGGYGLIIGNLYAIVRKKWAQTQLYFR